jgi:hypothetical protein
MKRDDVHFNLGAYVLGRLEPEGADEVWRDRGPRPVLDGNEKQALRCPDRGHVSRLEWLSENARELLMEKGERKLLLAA